MPLSHSFYSRDAREVAPELLNKVLAHGATLGRIVEVEAYVGSCDPASHAYRGRTARNATMFGPPGRLYVYFTYGMHWCANAVCSAEGTASAVLLRALDPSAGLSVMRSRRAKAKRDRDLSSGPARLCQALGIDGAADGANLVEGPVRILDDGTPPPNRPGCSVRIGLSKGIDLPWRWFVQDNVNVSRAPRGAKSRGERK